MTVPANYGTEFNEKSLHSHFLHRLMKLINSKLVKLLCMCILYNFNLVEVLNLKSFSM